MAATTLPTEVIFRIRRFDPEKDSEPHWEEYRLPYTAGMTVLDGLRRIKETASPTLAWIVLLSPGVIVGWHLPQSLSTGCGAGSSPTVRPRRRPRPMKWTSCCTCSRNVRTAASNWR